MSFYGKQKIIITLCALLFVVPHITQASSTSFFESVYCKTLNFVNVKCNQESIPQKQEEAFLGENLTKTIVSKSEEMVSSMKDYFSSSYVSFLNSTYCRDLDFLNLFKCHPHLGGNDQEVVSIEEPATTLQGSQVSPVSPPKSSLAVSTIQIDEIEMRPTLEAIIVYLEERLTQLQKSAGLTQESVVVQSTLKRKSSTNSRSLTSRQIDNIYDDFHDAISDSEASILASIPDNITHTGDAVGLTDLSVVALRGVSLDSTVGTPSDGDILVYRSAGNDFVLEAKPAGGSSTSFTLAGDTGTNQSIDDGNTMTVAGGTGIASVVSATDTITLNLDPASIASLALADTALQDIFEDTTPQLGGDLDANGNNITGLSDPILAQDAATKAYVDANAGASFGFGLDNQIPYTNSTTDDFDYSSNLTFDGTDLAVNTSHLFVDGGTGRVGIGNTNPSARLHTISTTEQLRLGYDASNYLSTTVGSTGGVTLDAVGVGAGFTFSDDVTAPSFIKSGGLSTQFLKADGSVDSSTYITSADDTVSGSELDGVFSTTGLLKRTGANTYTTITDNSTNWDTAFTERGSQIAGTNLTWSGTQLNVDDSFLLNTGDTATGDYNFDSGTLFVDSVNDRVGVGTATPTRALDVVGDIEASGIVYFGDSHLRSNGGITYLRGANSNGTIRFERTGNLQIYAATGTQSFEWDFGVNSIEQHNNLNPQSYALYGTRTDDSNYERLRFYADGSSYNIASEFAGTGLARDIALIGGNIGIGTTTPSARLHAISTTEQLRLGYDASNYWSGTVDATGGLSLAGTGTGNDLQITGNVGINASPASGATALRIDGNIQLDATHGISFRDSGEQISSPTTGFMQYEARTRHRFYADTNGNDAPGDEAFGFYANEAVSGATAKMVLTMAGDLGIGTAAPNEKLEVDGTIRASNLAGGATNLTTDANGNIIRDPSDIKLKKDIQTLEGSLNKVLALRGVSYEWKDTERFGTQKEIGFIAQEVEDVVPEVVRSGGEYKSINTRNLIAVVVGAVQELYEIVAGFGERLETKEVETEKLCVEGVCIDGSQLKKLLEDSEYDGSDSEESTEEVGDQLSENESDSEETTPDESNANSDSGGESQSPDNSEEVSPEEEGDSESSSTEDNEDEATEDTETPVNGESTEEPVEDSSSADSETDTDSVDSTEVEQDQVDSQEPEEEEVTESEEESSDEAEPESEPTPEPEPSPEPSADPAE